MTCMETDLLDWILSLTDISEGTFMQTWHVFAGINFPLFQVECQAGLKFG